MLTLSSIRAGGDLLFWPFGGLVRHWPLQPLRLMQSSHRGSMRACARALHSSVNIIAACHFLIKHFLVSGCNNADLFGAEAVRAEGLKRRVGAAGCRMTLPPSLCSALLTRDVDRSRFFFEAWRHRGPAATSSADSGEICCRRLEHVDPRLDHLASIRMNWLLSRSHEGSSLIQGQLKPLASPWSPSVTRG